jgi:hypothetical protein
MAGIEGEGRSIDPTAQPSTPTEQHKPHQECGNGASGIPPTLNERAKPPPEDSAYGGSDRTRVQEPQPLPDVLDVFKRKAQLGLDGSFPEGKRGRIMRSCRESLINSQTNWKSYIVTGQIATALF